MHTADPSRDPHSSLSPARGLHKLMGRKLSLSSSSRRLQSLELHCAVLYSPRPLSIQMQQDGNAKHSCDVAPSVSLVVLTLPAGPLRLFQAATRCFAAPSMRTSSIHPSSPTSEPSQPSLPSPFYSLPQQCNQPLPSSLSLSLSLCAPRSATHKLQCHGDGCANYAKKNSEEFNCFPFFPALLYYGKGTT